MHRDTHRSVRVKVYVGRLAYSRTWHCFPHMPAGAFKVFVELCLHNEHQNHFRWINITTSHGERGSKSTSPWRPVAQIAVFHTKQRVKCRNVENIAVKKNLSLQSLQMEIYLRLKRWNKKSTVGLYSSAHMSQRGFGLRQLRKSLMGAGEEKKVLCKWFRRLLKFNLSNFFGDYEGRGWDVGVG